MELHATATIGEVIGWNIRERRAASWTQPQFGQLIGTVLPKPWPAQTVSSAEKGERAFAAAELVAIAHLLEVSVAALFSPPLPVQTVTVTDELTVPAQMLHSTAAPQAHHEDISGFLYTEAWSTLGRIAKLRQNIVEQAQLIEQESRALFNRLDDIKGSLPDQDSGHPQGVMAEPHAHRVAELNELADHIQRERKEDQRPSSLPKQASNSGGIENA